MGGWFTSSASHGGTACVEVAIDPDAVHVRDSKYRRQPGARLDLEPIITVPSAEWVNLLGRLRGDDLQPGDLAWAASPDGSVRLWQPSTGTTLIFTSTEWDAYLVGVFQSEFDLAPA